MRIRHNKKRNTAFVYEALIVEATIAVIKNMPEKQNTAVNLLKKHFGKNSVLRKDLECYRSLYECQNIDKETSRRIIKESQLQKKLLESDNLFESQTSLVHDINKNLGSSVFNNFVPNYKTLATIAQLFSDNVSPKNKIILENQVINSMTQVSDEADGAKFDSVVYKTFASKFNDKYNNTLLPEQKELLTYYVSSFTDNALTLKTFLNEEISRLKTLLADANKIEEINSDDKMLEKTNSIVEKLDGFSKQPISDSLLLSVLKTQSLVKEIYSDGDSN